MNERIRELYRQASEQARVQACEKNNTTRPQNNTVWNEFVPLFADIIVKECMAIADLPNSADGKYDAFLPSEMIATHFGVEQ